MFVFFSMHWTFRRRSKKHGLHGFATSIQITPIFSRMLKGWMHNSPIVWTCMFILHSCKFVRISCYTITWIYTKVWYSYIFATMLAMFCHSTKDDFSQVIRHITKHGVTWEVDSRHDLVCNTNHRSSKNRSFFLGGVVTPPPPPNKKNDIKSQMFWKEEGYRKALPWKKIMGSPLGFFRPANRCAGQGMREARSLGRTAKRWKWDVHQLTF